MSTNLNMGGRWTAAERLNDIQEYYFSKKLQEIQILRSQGKEIINLGIGSPDLPPDSKVIQVAKEVLDRSDVHGYASYRGSIELRNAMSTWLKNFYHVSLKAENEILPLLGSKEGIAYLSLALLNPGDTVFVPNPGYMSYKSAAKIAGANVQEYKLSEKSHWIPCWDELEAQLTQSSLDSKVKLLWCNYPHMPTGSNLELSDFEKLVSLAKKYQFLIVNDNPYGLVLNASKPVSIISLDPQLDYVCELNSLSKSMNMAGWRVGMLLAHSHLIDLVIKVKSQFDSGMFHATQMAATQALKLNKSWHDNRNLEYQQRRFLLEKLFSKLKITFSQDQTGLFLWGKINSEETHFNSMEYCDWLLEEKNIFFTPGSIFGTQGEGYVRASLCANTQLLNTALMRIDHKESQP